MHDVVKFKMLVSIAAAVVLLTLAYSIAREYLVPDVEAYLQRKSYYERTISQKGLSLQKGLHWKEKR